MNEKIKYFIAGLFIGLSELLPGISGATVALMFGVYEKILNFLSRFKDFNLILPLIIGMIISVLSFSNIIDFLYKNYTDVFNFLISLLMIGYGCFLVINTYLKENINKGKGFYINLFVAIIIGFTIDQLYLSEIYNPSFISLILSGFFACSFLLFPGISGSAFLLAIGIYPIIIGSIANLNFEILIPFGFGMLIALSLMPRVIKSAYKKYGKSILIFFGGIIFISGINYFL